MRVAAPTIPRRANVLLVDDNPANLIVLEAVLSREYNIVRAYSGQQAIDELEKQDDVDVVLLDVQMPGMDGFETARRIQELPHAKDLPIIFVTAVYTEDEYIRHGYAAGGVDYFTKPFDPELLKRKVGIYASFRLRTELLRERERRMREAVELARVGRDLSVALEQLPAGVIVTDSAGRIVQSTDEARRVLRATQRDPLQRRDELIGWWSSEGWALTRPEGPLDRTLRHGEATHAVHLELRRLDGSFADLVASTLPLLGAGGEIAGAVVLIRDLGVARDLEANLERRARRLVGEDIEPGHAAPS
jgi:CheY-like chemotaxis protein